VSAQGNQEKDPMHDLTLFLSTLVLLAWLVVPAALLALAGFSAWTRNPLKQNHCWHLAEKLPW